MDVPEEERTKVKNSTPWLVGTQMLRPGTSHRAPAEETPRLSRNGPGLEISFGKDLIVLRNPSDPGCPIAELTYSQWRMFRELMMSPSPDDVSDRVSPSEGINLNRIRYESSPTASGEGPDAAIDEETARLDSTEGLKNLYQFLKWMIKYANGDGLEHRRFRTGLLIGWGLACVTMLVVGTSVAIARAGMPLTVAFSIGAGGTALFAVVTALIGRFRRSKK
jgi:hypothetical protein